MNMNQIYHILQMIYHMQIYKKTLCASHVLNIISYGHVGRGVEKEKLAFIQVYRIFMYIDSKYIYMHIYMCVVHLHTICMNICVYETFRSNIYMCISFFHMCDTRYICM